MWTEQLGCHIRRVGTEAATRLRLAVGPDGETLLPTGEEAERAAKHAERAAKEAERAAKEAAQRRVAELEAELQRRR